MWLNCCSCIIKLKWIRAHSYAWERKWFLETETAVGEEAMKFMEMTTKDLEHNLNLVEKSSSRLQEMNSNFERGSTVGKTTVKRALHAPEKSVKGRVIRCGKLHCRLLFRNCPTRPNLQQPPSWPVSRHRDWDKILHRQKDFDLWRHRWCSNYFILETQCC